MNKNVTAVILLVLSVGIYFTVTEGIFNDAKQVKAVNDQYVSAITNAEQLVRVRDQVLQNYNNISQIDRDRLDKMLPSTVDNIRLIIDLNGVAVRDGLTLHDISAAAPDNQSTAAVGNVNPNASSAAGVGNPTLDTVNVSFSVTSSYQQFISFLQDLEANLRIMDVKHLTLSAADNGQYTFQVTLNTYWLRQ